MCSGLIRCWHLAPVFSELRLIWRAMKGILNIDSLAFCRNVILNLRFVAHTAARHSHDIRPLKYPQRERCQHCRHTFMWAQRETNTLPTELKKLFYVYILFWTHGISGCCVIATGLFWQALYIYAASVQTLRKALALTSLCTVLVFNDD